MLDWSLENSAPASYHHDPFFFFCLSLNLDAQSYSLRNPPLPYTVSASHHCLTSQLVWTLVLPQNEGGICYIWCNPTTNPIFPSWQGEGEKAVLKGTPLLTVSALGFYGAYHQRGFSGSFLQRHKPEPLPSLGMCLIQPQPSPVRTTWYYAAKSKFLCHPIRQLTVRAVGKPSRTFFYSKNYRSPL